MSLLSNERSIQVLGSRAGRQGYLLKKQSGAVLLVALIMLLVLTLLGVASIDSSGMQTRMANNQRDRIIAMQAAEAGLLAAETYLENMHFSSENIGGCSPTSQDCFEATCEYGLCFTGVYTPILLTGIIYRSYMYEVGNATLTHTRHLFLEKYTENGKKAFY